MTVALEQTISQIQSLRNELSSLSPIKPESAEKLWRKFRLEWNYNSNHIEGNTLTYGETELLLIFDKTTGNHELREFEEMKAHDAAIFLIKEWASDENRNLTEADIRSLNKLILVKPFWKDAITPNGEKTRRLIKVGEYKEFPNSVRLKNGELFHYASPTETPKMMEDLMSWYKSRDQANMDPVLLSSEFHHRFVRIHPFDDGNGRIARLLVNFILMKNQLPPIIIKSQQKDEYLTALQHADVGNLLFFQNYIGSQLVWSLELSIKAAKGEDISEDDDIDKEIELFKREELTKTKVGTIKKNDQLIANLYFDRFKYLFDKIEEKHQKLDELFEINEYRRALNRSHPSNYINHDYLDDKMQKALEGNLSLQTGGTAPQTLNLAIHHKGYLRNGLNTFSTHHNISIQFDDYQMHIGDSYVKQRETFLYSNPPTKIQLKEMAKKMVEAHFEELKKKLK